jgi:hypothetical protein
MGEADLQRIMKELAVYSASTWGMHALSACSPRKEVEGGKEEGRGN